MLNSMADILSINWIAKCEKIPLIFVNELAQCIACPFIKLNNLLKIDFILYH